MATIRNSDPFKMGAARYQRKAQTSGERALWSGLRRKALGYRARRQYPVGDYILDFYIHEALLCVEVDGPLHDAAHDRTRDTKIGDLGILTIRIPAEDLPARLDQWVAEIRTVCERRVAQRSRTGL